MNFKNPGTHLPAWRVQLEQRITRDAVRRHEEETAPEWVVHRVVDRREVFNRRLLHRRTR